MSTQIALFRDFQGIVHLDPCFWYVQLLLTTSGTPFCIQTWKATSCPTLFLLYFAYLIRHYYFFVFTRKKKPFLKFYSLDVYLSEFFKLSLVGLWLGEEDEWPKRYSCLESMVGFFGKSVKDRKKWIIFLKICKIIDIYRAQLFTSLKADLQ